MMTYITIQRLSPADPDRSQLSKKLCYQLFQYINREKKMLIVFQLALVALVLLSFALVVGVPVGYATNQNWPLAKQLIFVGSLVWVALVVVVGVLNYFVV